MSKAYQLSLSWGEYLERILDGEGSSTTRASREDDWDEEDDEVGKREIDLGFRSVSERDKVAQGHRLRWETPRS